MSSREFTLYRPSDITCAVNSDGAVAITIAQNATPAALSIDNSTPVSCTLSGASDGVVFEQKKVWFKNRLPLLGSGGDVLEICLEGSSDVISYSFSFMAMAGVTYFSASTLSEPATDESTSDLFICLAKGTMIDTKSGPKPVESLKAGDLVWTEANGFQPMRWSGKRTVKAKGDLAPVIFQAGYFGATSDLAIAPTQRMLVSGPEVELLFGIEKALVRASDLVNGSTVTIDDGRDTVDYLHIMFDAHQIIRADGTLSESFFPSPQAIASLEGAQRQEIRSLFPELDQMGSGMNEAYPSLVEYEVALLSN